MAYCPPLPQGQTVMVDMNLGTNMMVGCAWDKSGSSESDLDTTVVLINEVGQVTDACYYNKQRSDCGAIVHSGDAVTGEKQGFDETININLPMVNFSVAYMAILVTNAKGGGFTNTTTATASIFQGATKLSDILLGEIPPGNNSVLVAVMRRVNPTWSFVNVTEWGPGTNFTESETLIRNSLKHAGFDAIMLEETKNWAPAGGARRFNMVKDQVIYLPMQVPNLQACLGWDAGCDVDCSILQFDKAGNMYDQASFMKKRTNDGSIIHSGDNTTGDAKGDDEVINIHLPQVSSNVETIWPVITIYSSGQQFDDVKNAYVRIIDPKSRNEFCRFNLSDNRDNISTGSIVGCIKRNGDSWTFKSLGYYVTNSKTCDQVVPKIKQVMQNNLKEIIIIKPGQKFAKDNNQSCCEIF